MQKECIAMLLAGGEGSRLGNLTKDRAKPAVPFGGKYRIIDFPLSNCVNSRIDTVGVLTQYQPLELNDYIGNGQPWDLDRNDGGVHILPPYQKRETSDWYKGTANAIKQNIPFIRQYNPTYLLILSGDHIYKMDYSKMLEYHKKKKADCTIAVINVPLSEASRFGILNTDEDGKIYEFEEKPQKPKSTNASMGIYVFTFDKLLTYLGCEGEDTNSANDFGKHIIPRMLSKGETIYAYSFEGYWKDVGTIESLWESNMDLIHLDSNILYTNTDWKIYARSPILPPHYISPTASVKNCIVSEGCYIEGTLEDCVIFHGVTVEENTLITNSILFPGSHIKKGSCIHYAVIDENTAIAENSFIGSSANKTVLPSKNLVVISKDNYMEQSKYSMENFIIEAAEAK
ncbi:glucose-1-phosphate adenylyltransferase [Anaerocolumna cellulosilytica]|uniref:Glucose-1-phosphate adenylyltransferase n=1 Tax=Anaerocolumna cellulosilytica TaxID=433286 RepID=A0A6S6R1A7_9FIRM|nr:glucose-1-phosphate adenylyltransferase [Anaerocolumna cellulosilytica]MBB5197777.1 glucose-1-phosphate adenylyltransferase [Anaerocolumna cellulosilytica]BCJ93011.1 glucose-1-phosphate adenylyltransferase [Anaerocolumna cellulosilytica]